MGGIAVRYKALGVVEHPWRAANVPQDDDDDGLGGGGRTRGLEATPNEEERDKEEDTAQNVAHLVLKSSPRVGILRGFGPRRERGDGVDQVAFPSRPSSSPQTQPSSRSSAQHVREQLIQTQQLSVPHSVSTTPTDGPRLPPPPGPPANNQARRSSSPTYPSYDSRRPASASKCVQLFSRYHLRPDSTRTPQIACYKNTVRSYRSGAQTDLSEVIQIDNVFSNVSKGAVASSDDLQKAFGTTDVQKVLLEVLKKGELQVGEKERAVELEDLKKEICTEVAGRCVDPGTQRPHTVGMIEKAMGEVGYSVKPGKSAKVQVGRLFTLLASPRELTTIVPGARPHQGPSGEQHPSHRPRSHARSYHHAQQGWQAAKGQASRARVQG